jgi:magnesium-transporting ATPase (P-type)
MGRSGTDVAREAADLVLLDDEFGTIVEAVAQGRATFRNIRRFLTYHLTDNVPELAPFAIWALSGGQFPLAIGVLQVLALDIGTDLLPALALGAEPPSGRALDSSPVRGHLIDAGILRRAFGRLGPTEVVVEMTAFVAVLLAAGWRPGDPTPTGSALLAASGAAFTAVVLGQLAVALACRSTTRWVGQTGVRGNPLLAWSFLVELAMLAVFLTVPPVADLLGHQLPTLLGMSIAVLAIPAVILVDLLDKTHRRRRSEDAVMPPAALSPV